VKSTSQNVKQKRIKMKCPECGHEIIPKPKPPKKENIVETELVKIIYPDANKIIKYTKANAEDTFFALKILNNQILDLFITTKVSEELFLKSIKNLNFYKKMDKIFKPHFYKIEKISF
jgi:DNA-directed RNA polymerase subunit RPC12/RpoP